MNIQLHWMGSGGTVFLWRANDINHLSADLPWTRHFPTYSEDTRHAIHPPFRVDIAYAVPTHLRHLHLILIIILILFLFLALGQNYWFVQQSSPQRAQTRHGSPRHFWLSVQWKLDRAGRGGGKDRGQHHEYWMIPGLIWPQGSDNEYLILKLFHLSEYWTTTCTLYIYE